MELRNPKFLILGKIFKSLKQGQIFGVSQRGLLRASARMRHRRRGAARTERALCRRRARATPFRRARPKHPNPGQFNTKTGPLNLRDDARPPNHPDRALRHRNCSSVILVHGNRLGPPI